MRQTTVSLRGRQPGTELITVHVILASRHQLGWRGWIVDDLEPQRAPSPSAGYHPLLYLTLDWVEYASIDQECP